MKYYDKLIFEHSKSGCRGYSLPKTMQNAQCSIHNLPKALLRESETMLPEVSELQVVRHYTNVSNKNFGVETGFYPLGSCTMKYNPKINEEMAALPAFTSLHPLQPAETVQGALELYYNFASMLSEISGLAEFTLNPFAGAHGELTGLMIMRAYHNSRGDLKRTKVIVPNSAHGTNPATATVCGLETVEIISNANGTVNIEALKAKLDDTVAGIMLTNPNTIGMFETEIPEIARLVHEAGGLLYYDGANLNPLLGKCRPGDMGFDIMHINVHKTFSTPHGGGGPGSGPVGVVEKLRQFLPTPRVVKQGDGYAVVNQDGDSLGSISGFFGNYGVVVRGYSYLLTLGKENLKMVGPFATLNANYIKESLKDDYLLPVEGICKHEFVFDGLRDKSTGVTTLDIAKRLLDYGYHAPTIYFPLLFSQSIMIEPTETESLETLDEFIAVMKQVAEEARTSPDLVKGAPYSTPVRRLDETSAAKNPILQFKNLD